MVKYDVDKEVKEFFEKSRIEKIISLGLNPKLKTISQKKFSKMILPELKKAVNYLDKKYK